MDRAYGRLLVDYSAEALERSDRVRLGENPNQLVTIERTTNRPNVRMHNESCERRNVDLPREKRIEIGLTYIYGIGRPTADKLLAEAGVNPDTRVRDITDDEVKKISEAIEKLGVMVEGDLRREIALNIKRLQEIGCYRGIRHRKGLPVRGQKTKTNARTRKGPKRTVANKKK